MGFLINLEGPAPSGTVACSGNLAKEGILARVGLSHAWSCGALASATGAQSPLRVDKCFSVLGLTCGTWEPKLPWQ